MSALHGRLSALLALISLLAFVSGAGLGAPSVLPAAAVLLLAVIAQPSAAWSLYFEQFWRVAALVLAGRAALRVYLGIGDPVLPMVDLLLLLLCAESLRQRDGSGDARHLALTFALLIASAAYRPGPLFGLLFVAYVIVGTVVLVLGHLNRESRQHGHAAPAPPPRFVARLALISTVVLAASVIVFVVFPRVSQGWAARSSPPVARAMVGFSDRVSIGQHGTRIEANPEVVLRVEFPGGRPANPAALHWRGRGYNRFDGMNWSRGDRSLLRGRAVTVSSDSAVIEQVIYARPLREANVLFGLHPVIDITPLSRITPVRVRGDDYLYTGDADPVYRVRSRAATPAPDALRRVRHEYPPEVVLHLQLPAVTSRMLALADSLRRSAPTMYDQVRAVQHYLGSFAYTLDLPASRREATLDHFIFERRAGHCEYFSTAMAILLRAGGVATRNVNGFLGGEWNEFGQYLTVTQNNAHSWVEVYFPGHGWITFDPTPSAAAVNIARGAGATNSLRMLFDGLGHRWGKWILDYDLGRQLSLLQRVARPFTGDRADEDDGAAGSPLRLMAWLVAGAVSLLVIFLRRRWVAAQPQETRVYLRMRQAYERAGFPAARRMPPLAFATIVGDAPGADEARRAVRLYLRARFGGVGLDDDESAQLYRAAAAARDAILQSPAGKPTFTWRRLPGRPGGPRKRAASDDPPAPVS